ncbi:hypothetical protein Clocel_4201 [Clostridium cellulovorans 743B]|uniref:Uncharacterized protein n=1 Tax=Clostridium cellulovorans (strain ATCC 35296 / DSM 3052 / OCM 3 / 743B) TaxID=573061 RepID=D9SMK6_CLOC7|nr:hypothetical protein Clocel_4201 [Clostridium cellulovorans 743B]
MEISPFNFIGGEFFSILVLYKAKKMLSKHADDNKDEKVE